MLYAVPATSLNNKVVPVLLNSHLEKDLLFNLIENYCPEYLWVPTSMVEEFSNCKSVFEAYGYALLKTSFDKKYTLSWDLLFFYIHLINFSSCLYPSLVHL